MMQPLFLIFGESRAEPRTKLASACPWVAPDLRVSALFLVTGDRWVREPEVCGHAVGLFSVWHMATIPAGVRRLSIRRSTESQLTMVRVSPWELELCLFVKLSSLYTNHLAANNNIVQFSILRFFFCFVFPVNKQQQQQHTHTEQQKTWKSGSWCHKQQKRRGSTLHSLTSFHRLVSEAALSLSLSWTERSIISLYQAFLFWS